MRAPRTACSSSTAARLARPKAYDNDKLDASTARSLKLIKLGVSAPAPADAAKRAELAALSTELEAMYGEGKYCPTRQEVRAGIRQGREGLQEPRHAGRNHRHQPQLRRAHRGLDGLALDRKTDAPEVHSASRSSRTKARASSASRTSECCGVRVTTCRPRISRRKPRVSTTRSGRCTKACTATRAASWRRNTARTRCRRASPSRRTCSATCGPSSGTASMTTC